MVGIKPTVGLVSRNGVVPLAHSFDTAGPIARDVTDAASLLSAVSEPDPTDVVNQRAPGGPPAGHGFTAYLTAGALRGSRIGYSTADEPSDPAAAAVWDAARAALTAAGATLVETDTLANTGSLSLTEIAGIPSEFKYGVADYLAHEAGPVGGAHGRPALVTDDLTGVIAYNQLHSDRIPYGQSLLEASDATAGATQNDPSSTGTILNARQSIDGTLTAGTLDAYVAPDAAYAGSGAAAGYPSVTVPDGYTPATIGSTPHGIQFLGTAWAEPKLVGLAYSYEQATRQRTPATVSDPAVTAGVTCASPPTTTTPATPVVAPAAAPAPSTAPTSTAGRAPTAVRRASHPARRTAGTLRAAGGAALRAPGPVVTQPDRSSPSPAGRRRRRHSAWWRWRRACCSGAAVGRAEPALGQPAPGQPVLAQPARRRRRRSLTTPPAASSPATGSRAATGISGRLVPSVAPGSGWVSSARTASSGLRVVSLPS